VQKALGDLIKQTPEGKLFKDENSEAFNKVIEKNIAYLVEKKNAISIAKMYKLPEELFLARIEEVSVERIFSLYQAHYYKYKAGKLSSDELSTELYEAIQKNMDFLIKNDNARKIATRCNIPENDFIWTVNYEHLNRTFDKILDEVAKKSLTGEAVKKMLREGIRKHADFLKNKTQAKALSDYLKKRLPGIDVMSLIAEATGAAIGVSPAAPPTTKAKPLQTPGDTGEITKFNEEVLNRLDEILTRLRKESLPTIIKNKNIAIMEAYIEACKHKKSRNEKIEHTAILKGVKAFVAKNKPNISEWDITNFAMLSVHAKQILEIFKDAEAQFREREQPSGKLR
ncbi:MAG TPA: hypothetical protein VJ205_02080, partial [Gammaproteobacteria bacterium]|nr:hypothetical protein [Gammaproteobacteria bacterium]